MRQAIAVQHILISIHALREEGDQVQGALDREPEKFLSTPSARRATLRSVRQDVRNDISIHALREEGDDWCPRRKDDAEYFYPRPPRGGRLSDYTEMVADGDFYPRPPRGGRHLRKEPCRMTTSISIHALREEGDSDMDDTENT